ncbi:MAG: hypothetical protein Q9195_000892 [Heterodermia aff. obscurata]
MPSSNSRKSAESSRYTASRPQTGSSTVGSDQPRFSQVFTGHHLDDDQSHYQKEHGQALGEERLGELQSFPLDDLEYGHDGVFQNNSVEDLVENREGITNKHDVEAPRAIKRSSMPVKDPDLVTWEGPDDPANPKNWSKGRRWGATLVVSSFTFISPVSSSLVAPAISTISQEFNITNAVEQQMVLSVFILAYALGPLFLGPFSEIYGRVPIFGIFLLQETYPPKILHAKAKKLRKQTGRMSLHTEFEHPERSLANTLQRALVRPFRLLGTQPIVQVLALYMAYIYGLTYLLLSTFPRLWTERYHESIGIGGLNYISLALGFFVATQICGPASDMIYRRLKARNGDVGKPEFRIPILLPGSVLIPIGLFIYGWTAQYHVHWIAPNIGTFIFSAGTIMGFQAIQTYIVDAYTTYAASAIGAVTVLRSLAGFGFPLFAPYMYDALDDGWGNSLLGFLAIGIGLPAPVLLWLYGQKLRERSPFAAG